MKTRALFLIIPMLIMAPAIARAQHPAVSPSTLPALRSEGELARFVGELNDENLRRRRARAECVGGGTVHRQGTAGSRPGPAVIRGRVTGARGRGVGSAIVQVSSLNARVTTTSNGRFRLVIPAERLSAARSIIVSATRVGLVTTQQRLTVAPGDSSVVDFQLCDATLALGAVTTAAGAVGKEGGAADAVESVTNTQTQGVDEGGIVKVHGDHLVMLRRGRLFTVAIADRRLTPVSAVDAFGPGIDPRGTWYDEMLVSGNRVVVVGYSYQRGGTELGLFDIDRQGRLRYHSTWHLRSDDYYSSRNYASRLVGNELVFYTPLRVRPGDTVAAWLPALRRWHTGAGDDEFRPIAAAPRIYHPGRPLDAEDDLALHTVTTCDLARPELRCRATGVLGPRGRVVYVSPTSVYVWVSDWRRARQGHGQSMVYRLPLDGSSPTAVGAAGTPVDQFSFMEDATHLNVLVRSGARGEGMWGAERAAGSASLLRLPLERFGNGAASAPRAAYRELPGTIDGHTFQNRFVGRHLLYGRGSGWGSGSTMLGGQRLYVTPLAARRVDEIELPHGVDRIDVMGPDAVVVGTDGENLHFSGIDLGSRPRVKQRYVSRGASQGELRSHGFFYKPDAGDGGSGVLGLPIRGPGRPGYEHLFNGSASVVFLRNDDASFRPLGELDARPEGSASDGCVASCIDWYGNARPLFLRGRVFALLGYEIVEGEVVDGRIREVQRVSYAPRQGEAARR